MFRNRDRPYDVMTSICGSLARYPTVAHGGFEVRLLPLLLLASMFRNLDRPYDVMTTRH